MIRRVRHLPPCSEVHLCACLSSYWLISVTIGLLEMEKTTYVAKPSCIVQDKRLCHENSFFSGFEREMIVS